MPIIIKITRSLKIKNVKNDKIIIRFHDSKDPIHASISLNRKIHRNHPTMSLFFNTDYI